MPSSPTVAAEVLGQHDRDRARVGEIVMAEQPDGACGDRRAACRDRARGCAATAARRAGARRGCGRRSDRGARSRSAASRARSCRTRSRRSSRRRRAASSTRAGSRRATAGAACPSRRRCPSAGCRARAETPAPASNSRTKPAVGPASSTASPRRFGVAQALDQAADVEAVRAGEPLGAGRQLLADPLAHVHQRRVGPLRRRREQEQGRQPRAVGQQEAREA